MIEGGFFQSIQCEVGAEAGVEDSMQGTIEVVVRDGFADHTDAFLRTGVQVFHDFDGVGGDHFAVEWGFLDAERHTVVVEARVGEGEDKAATGFDDLTNAAHQRVDLGHVHDSHVADGSVEAELPEGDNLVLVGGIEEVVFDAVGIFGGTGAGTFKKLLAEVSCDDVDTKLGHAASEDSIATGDFKHCFARLQVKQAFAGGSNEETLKIVAAVTHSVIPE